MAPHSSLKLPISTFALGMTVSQVTDQVLYISKDENVVEVSGNGLVSAAGSGETTILIRAAGHAASAGFGVIEKPIVDYPEVERRNFIDESVFSKLRKFNIIITV